MENKLKENLDFAKNGLNGIMEYIINNIDQAKLTAAQKKDLIAAKKNVDSKLKELAKETEKLNKIKL